MANWFGVWAQPDLRTLEIGNLNEASVRAATTKKY